MRTLLPLLLALVVPLQTGKGADPSLRLTVRAVLQAHPDDLASPHGWR